MSANQQIDLTTGQWLTEKPPLVGGDVYLDLTTIHDVKRRLRRIESSRVFYEPIEDEV